MGSVLGDTQCVRVNFIRCFVLFVAGAVVYPGSVDSAAAGEFQFSISRH